MFLMGMFTSKENPFMNASLNPLNQVYVFNAIELKDKTTIYEMVLIP